MAEPVRIAPHDPGWPAAAAREANRLRAALGPWLTLHHIGSTAVPGLQAKPILDLLGVAPALPLVDGSVRVFEGLGYEAMGEFGIPGRRYFRRSDGAGRRSHHLHVFAQGSAHVARHLAFRDYLRAHPHAAAEYSALKARLAAAPGATARSYADGKDAFVAAMEADALRWTAGT